MKQFKLTPCYKSKFFMTLMLLLTLMFALSLSTHSQNVVREGRTFIVIQSDSTKSGGYTKTDYKYQDKTGIYDVYLSSRGSAFIFKISKKTNKQYRKYLPKITQEIKKEDNGKH